MVINNNRERIRELWNVYRLLDDGKCNIIGTLTNDYSRRCYMTCQYMINSASYDWKKSDRMTSIVWMNQQTINIKNQMDEINFEFIETSN